MFLGILFFFVFEALFAKNNLLTINCHGGKLLEGNPPVCDCSNEFRDGKFCNDTLSFKIPPNYSLLIHLVTSEVLHPFSSQRHNFGDLNVTSVNHQCAIGWNKNKIFISENRGNVPSKRDTISIKNRDQFIKIGNCNFPNPFYMRTEKKNNKHHISVMNIGFVILALITVIFIIVVIGYKKWKNNSNKEDLQMIKVSNCDDNSLKQEASTNQRCSLLGQEAMYTKPSPTLNSSNEEDQPMIESDDNQRCSLLEVEDINKEPSATPINSDTNVPSDAKFDVSKQVMYISNKK